MCDFFWQRMENDQGDLADIVRASGLGGPPPTDLQIADWQLPVEPTPFPPPTLGLADEFGDPFANLHDPLLHGLAGVEFFDGPDAATGAGAARVAAEGGDALLAQKILSEEMKRPCNIFSRMLQISPAAAKGGPPLSQKAIRGSPIAEGEMMKVSSGSAGCPADHGAGVPISSPRSTPGIKRRKGQAKKVVCIPAPAAASSRPGEVVPSDLWAWRKYGQKPIKGSPYPRGYYRCSSSKGCSARKQVERSRTDPNMLVITYTSEHNHPWPTQRNVLAGSTRAQPAKNGSSSSSKSSHHSQRPPACSKEERPKEATSSSTPLVKEEVGEITMERAIDGFDQVFHRSYEPMIPDSNLQPDDFFADLAELEPDPMSLIFSKEFMGDKSDEESSNKALDDPFNMFD